MMLTPLPKFAVSPLTLLLLFTAMLLVTKAELPGIYYIGEGYDLLKANPDGGNPETGGTDPGIKHATNVLELTYRKHDKSRKIPPKEVKYSRTSSCSNRTSYEMYTGTKSYQKKFGTQVEASAEGGGGLWEFSFSASAGYEEAQEKTTKEGNVFFEENVVCNMGTARYDIQFAKAVHYNATPEFRASVCGLPDQFSRTPYKTFIAKWGTHVITKIDFGTRYTKTYKMSKKQFYTKAMKSEKGSVSVSAGGFGFSGSVSVSVDKFKEEAVKRKDFGEQHTEIDRGTPELPVPIKTEITPISKFIKNSYFGNGCPRNKKNKPITKKRISQLRENMKKALQRYPVWIKARKPQDVDMSIPLTWPNGNYGLQKTAEGCPNPSNFIWHEGMSHWNNVRGRNSDGNHFPAGTPRTIEYCVKTDDDVNALLDWPPGTYCIMRKGPQCPTGFAISSLTTMTPKSVRNSFKLVQLSSLKGTVPSIDLGDEYSKRFLCCRNDDFPSNSIYLPSDKPFYLFMFGHECQAIKGMISRVEWFEWDSDPFSNAFIQTAPAPPKGSILTITRDGKERYCYYQKATP